MTFNALPDQLLDSTRQPSYDS